MQKSQNHVKSKVEPTKNNGSTSTLKINAKYTPITNLDGVFVNFKATQPFEENNDTGVNSKYIIIMLDISGSMSGSPLDTCKQVLLEMFKYIHNELGNTNIDLGLFDTSVHISQVKNKPLDYCLDQIKQIRIGGGTAFIPVFNKIQSLIQDNNEDNVAVVLLSDGCAESIDVLRPYIDKMKKFMASNTKSSEFHALGFGSGHDAKLLSAIPNSGTSQGTFQYIKSTAEINQAMEAVSSFFSQNNFGATWINDKKEEKIFFQGEDDPFADERTWKGSTFVQMSVKNFEKICSDLKIRVKQGKTEQILSVQAELEEFKDNTEMIKNTLQAISFELKKITNILTTQKCSKEYAEELTTTTNNYRKTLDQISKEIFKLKIMEREPLFAQVGDLSEYLNTFSGLLSKNFLGQLNNEQIANLNSLAYRDVTRKALLKKLDKRASKSVPIINEAFEKVDEISKKLNTAELQKKYSKEIGLYGNCLLSCQNFVDALGDSDCLCMTFDLARPEIAIADCTRITIKKIYPTIMSAKSFMECAKYSIKLNTKASGGFDEEASGSIVKGSTNEDITGVLPLFICPEHWQIASLLMKPILGWVITLDPVGYSYFQKKILPFMLLGHALQMKEQNPNGEFSNRCHDMLLETCIQIVRDDMDPEFGGTMREEFLETHQRYLDDGSVRTLDVIQSNFVHLAYVYVFWKMGIIERPQRQDLLLMMTYMVEEELRRRQDTWKPDRIEENIIELLTVNVDKYLKRAEEIMAEHSDNQEVVKSVGKVNLNDNEITFLLEMESQNPQGLTAKEKIALSEYRNKNDSEPKPAKKEEEKKSMDKNDHEEEKKSTDVDAQKKPEKSLAEILEEELQIPKSEFIKGELMKDLTYVQGKAEAHYRALYEKFYRDLFRWFKFFYPDDKDFDLNNYNSLEKIGLNTPAQMMALFIQNQVHQKNSDRKSAFTSGRHQNPWKVAQAEAFLERTYRRIILTRLKQKSKKRNAADSVASSGVEFFAFTESLEDAAGILLGNGFDLSSYQFLLNIMRTKPESCKLMKEKLLMLKHKEYRGVKLLTKLTFHLRKGGLKKMFKKFVGDYKYNEWKEIWFTK